MVATTDVHDVLPIVRDRYARQLLTVVGGVVGEAARRESRAFGDPDIAQPALIECPRDSGPGVRRGELARKWIALYLFDRECSWCPLRGEARRDEGNTNNGQCEMALSFSRHLCPQ